MTKIKRSRLGASRSLETEEAAFVIQEAFLNLESLAVLSKPSQTGGFIAHHLPLL